MTMTYGFSRAGRTGQDDILVRSKELEPLREKTIAVFGLGCLGAPSAIEFARAGTGRLRFMDHDFVDPAAAGRWPLGLSVAGLLKTEVIRDLIHREYPWTEVEPFTHKLGAVREIDQESDIDVMEKMTADTSLIYDATAELGVHHYLSVFAREQRIPYIGVIGTPGGWGGKVFRIMPDKTEGCWMCHQYACSDGTIIESPFDPNGLVQPRGCGDPTFTGAGFDLVQIALTGVRMAIATLCSGHARAYPDADWDVLTIAFRDQSGNLIAPTFQSYKLQRHKDCPDCRM